MGMKYLKIIFADLPDKVEDFYIKALDILLINENTRKDDRQWLEDTSEKEKKHGLMSLI